MIFFFFAKLLTLLYGGQSWRTVLCYSVTPFILPTQSWTSKVRAYKTEWRERGEGRGEKTEIQEGLACIITLSRWHIYRLCQRGHAFCRSKRSGV